MEMDEIYKPEIKTMENLGGFVMNCSRGGEEVRLLQKGFVTSYGQFERVIMKNAIQMFAPEENIINNLLVVVRDSKARIYREFPLTLQIRSKVDLKQSQAIFKNQILDIEGVIFKDAIFELDVKDGDKFLWFFRRGFSFGLYFDFSSDLNVNKLFPELGRCYRSIEYYEICKFWEESVNSKRLFTQGWFPFIQLLGHGLERLQATNELDLERMVESLVNTFTKERIEGFTTNWWSNPIFLKKKTIINAGLSSYLKGDRDDIINCIKNLLPEIEGIIRISYHHEVGTVPSMKELKKYLLEKAEKKFSADGSLGFPGLFAGYLNEVIFKGFDLQNDDISLSRHTVSHGVAPEEAYTKERALQCILTLDQMFFYLGRSET